MDNAYILIVDDDTALLQALPQTLYLRVKNVKVDTCDSALDAVEKIKQNDYDAIVSDIKMPGMDGLALLAKVRELQPSTPTLLITGHGDHNLAIQALRGGAYDFIQKPIDRDYFIAALQRAIQTHQLARQVAEQQQALEQHTRMLELTVQERTRDLVDPTGELRERMEAMGGTEVVNLVVLQPELTFGLADVRERSICSECGLPRVDGLIGGGE